MKSTGAYRAVYFRWHGVDRILAPLALSPGPCAPSRCERRYLVQLEWHRQAVSPIDFFATALACGLRRCAARLIRRNPRPWISQNLGTDGLEWTSLRWSCIAVAGINGIWYGSACVHCWDIQRTRGKQLIQKQLLMQSVSQAQQNVLLKEQVRETKRRHLKSQMNPHFIFNVLTGSNLLQMETAKKPEPYSVGFVGCCSDSCRKTAFGAIGPGNGPRQQVPGTRTNALGRIDSIPMEHRVGCLTGRHSLPALHPTTACRKCHLAWFVRTGVSEPSLRSTSTGTTRTLSSPFATTERAFVQTDPKSSHKSRGTAIVKATPSCVTGVNWKFWIALWAFAHGVMARMTLPCGRWSLHGTQTKSARRVKMPSEEQS